MADFETTPGEVLSNRRMKIAVATLLIAALATMGGVALGATGRVSQQVTPPTPEVFVGIQPVRVLDTRAVTVSGDELVAPQPLSGGETLDVTVAGFADRNGAVPVPANASSVAVNITIDDDATLKSFITVWPAGQPQPATSAINAEPGLVVSNSAILSVGANGRLSVFNQQGNVNVIMDITGYFVDVPTVAATTTVPDFSTGDRPRPTTTLTVGALVESHTTRP
jgi:hypothetical protein